MKRGFTCSTFDLLHAGHLLMLEEAKSVCDHLIVGLQTGAHHDGRKPPPVQTVYERWTQLRACRWVDEIVPYDTESDLLDLLQTLPIDVRIIGSDWLSKPFTGDTLPIPVHYNRREHPWSTTTLKQRVIAQQHNSQP